MSTEEGLAMRIARLQRPLLLAFDVDGTLAPIVADAAKAGVPATAERALQALAKVEGVHVALITGRDLAGLSRMVTVPGAYRAVEHGALLVPPTANDEVPGLTADDQAKLDAFSAWAERHAVPRGASLERKRQSRGVHTRALAQRDAKLAERILREASEEAERLGLHARHGRAVLEAELSPGDKGEALQRVQEAVSARGVLFAGDDLTDLPAIRHAVDQGGVGVFVASEERPDAPSFATATLRGTHEVHALLDALVSAFRR